MFLIYLLFYNLFVQCNEINNEQYFSKDICLNYRVIEILKKYFLLKDCLTFIYLSEDMYVPNEYFLFSNLPQIIVKENESTYNFLANMTYRPRRDFHTTNGNIAEFCEERIEGFIIFSPSLDTLISYTFSNMVTAFMNPKAYFFVYLSEHVSKDKMSEFFIRLWNVYRVPHISVTCCTCTHAYTPSVQNGAAIHDIYNDSIVLYRKIHQLQGLQFKTCMFPSVMSKEIITKNGIDYEGLDRMLVDLLAEKMNFTKVVVTSPNDETFGRRQADGSFNGALGILLTGRADFASVGFFAMDYQTRDVEPTQGVQVDDLCAVVHRSKEVPPWLAPVRYFGAEVCIALTLVYFGVVGVWIFIRRFEIPRKNFETNLVFLNTFRLMLISSVPRLPRTSGERVFLAFCTLAFLTFAGTFQGTLVTVYSTQFFYKEINTLEDLAEYGLPILTRFESFKADIFTNESNPTRAKLKDLVRIYNGSIPINNIVAYQGNVGGLTRRSSIDLDHEVVQYVDKNGKSLLHLVKECIRTYNLAYMLPRSSALSPRINEIILRASQAGLFEKWYRDMAVNNTKYSSKKQTQGRNQDENVPLSLEDLQLAMYGLVAGMFISLLAFVFETVLVQLRCIFSKRRL